MMADDPRATEARALPMAGIVERLGLSVLTRAGTELVGPCPRCGGTDRFAVNPARGVWNCRGCAKGGDGIALVQLALGLDFRAALDWLCGPVQDIDPAELEARQRKAAAAAAARQRREAEERARAIGAARRLWATTREAEGTPVRDYLARRGIAPHLLALMPKCLRFAPDCPYVVAVAGRPREGQVIHRGPAMIACVQDPGGEITAVHRTWLDLRRDSGKADLGVHPDTGRPLPAKKVLGSKKGGAIRLRSPQAATTLVMGEGIETTLSALVAEARPFTAAFWAGVDLGNMAGRQQRGEGLRYAGLPDLGDADAFLPPPNIRRLVYVMDGDSEPRLTRAKLEAGLRRAMLRRPGLEAGLVLARAGADLNDMLRGEG